jgi:hypothetical protein
MTLPVLPTKECWTALTSKKQQRKGSVLNVPGIGGDILDQDRLARPERLLENASALQGEGQAPGGMVGIQRVGQPELLPVQDVEAAAVRPHDTGKLHEQIVLERPFIALPGKALRRFYQCAKPLVEPGEIPVARLERQPDGFISAHTISAGS